MKNRLVLTRTGMRSSRLLSCFAAVFISTVMPDYSDALRYGLTLALLAAYALLCLSIWQRQRRRRLAAVAEAAQAMQAAGRRRFRHGFYRLQRGRAARPS